MPKSGCKQVLIPLLIAALFIVVMLVMGTESNQYSTPVSAFVPRDGADFRLEGDIRKLDVRRDALGLSLCDGSRCVQAEAPLSNVTRLHVGDRVIVSGRWTDNRLCITRILTRCH